MCCIHPLNRTINTSISNIDRLGVLRLRRFDWSERRQFVCSRRVEVRYLSDRTVSQAPVLVNFRRNWQGFDNLEIATRASVS